MNDQEIVRIAKARSNEMLASTQAKADALRRASSQFCDEALRRTEEAISAALGNVQLFSFFRRKTQRLVAGKTTGGLTELSEFTRNWREFLLAISLTCHYNEDYMWGEVV